MNIKKLGLLCCMLGSFALVKPLTIAQIKAKKSEFAKALNRKDWSQAKKIIASVSQDSPALASKFRTQLSMKQKGAAVAKKPAQVTKTKPVMVTGAKPAGQEEISAGLVSAFLAMPISEQAEEFKKLPKAQQQDLMSKLTSDQRQALGNEIVSQASGMGAAAPAAEEGGEEEGELVGEVAEEEGEPEREVAEEEGEPEL